MRPIPAPRLGDAHGLIRAIEQRGRLRTDEFVTEFKLEDLFPPGLENALGRMRHFISYARSAGLVKEDRGVVELTDLGRRYIRSGDPDAFYDVSAQQGEWLRRQLREKHMTDSIFHGLSIGLSLLTSVPPGVNVATLDFGRSMAYLGRAGWDNENTLQIQGERHLTLLRDMELIDEDRRVTPAGHELRSELTLPIHMALLDLASQLNPGGADAARAAAAAEFGGAAAEPEPPAEPSVSEAAPAPAGEDDDDGYHTAIGLGAATAEPSQPPVVPRPSEPPPGPAYDSPTEISQPAPPPSSVPPPTSAAPPPVAAEPPVSTPPPASFAPENIASEAGEAAPVEASAAQVAPPEVVPLPDATSSGPPPAALAGAEAAETAPPPVGPPPAAAPSAPPPAGPAEAEAAETAPPPVGPPPDAAPSGPPPALPPEVGPPPGAVPRQAPPADAGAAGGAPPEAVPADGAVAAGPPSEEMPADASVVPADAEALAGAPSEEVPVDPAGEASAGSAVAEGAPGEAPVVAPGDVANGGLPAAEVAGAEVEVGAGPASADVTPDEVGGGPEVLPEVAPAADVVPAEVVGSVPPPVPVGVRDELGGGGFVDARVVRAAAEEAGLRLPAGVYANVVAGLAAGRHLLLTGSPGAGKTTLALAVARAAAQGGRAQGATVVTAGPDAAAAVTEAGRRGRWLVLDELDRVDPDGTLGPLSTFLGGLPVTLGGKEVAPAADWRLVATWSGPLPQASVLRRFAVVEVGGPPAEALRSAIRAAAQGDATAAAAAERLLPLADTAPIGAGVFLAAARHAAERNAIAPADAATLAREAYAAYIAPLLGDAAGDRLRDLLGDTQA
jgi:hypothetical protein